MPDALCVVSPKHSSLIYSVMERIPKFCRIFSPFILIRSGKCRTVMHEAIVAELHPQDHRFLPRSAVPLHQKSGHAGEIRQM